MKFFASENTAQKVPFEFLYVKFTFQIPEFVKEGWDVFCIVREYSLAIPKGEKI